MTGLINWPDSVLDGFNTAKDYVVDLYNGLPNTFKREQAVKRELTTSPMLNYVVLALAAAGAFFIAKRL